MSAALPAMMCTTRTTVTLSPHGDGRIDPRCAKRWHPARDNADRSHHRRDGDKGRRVVRRNAKEQASNDTRRKRGTYHSEHEPDHDQHAALTEDHPLHASAVGTKAHANANLVRS